MNNSHNTNLYKSNTIVMCPNIFGAYEPAFIESRDNSNERPDDFRYSATLWEGITFYEAERRLRPMTFREFALFRHPLTGSFMVGKNRAWISLFIHLFAVAVLFAAPYADPWWAPVAITVGMIAGFWFFTYKQFNGTQV